VLWECPAIAFLEHRSSCSKAPHRRGLVLTGCSVLRGALSQGVLCPAAVVLCPAAVVLCSSSSSSLLSMYSTAIFPEHGW